MTLKNLDLSAYSCIDILKLFYFYSLIFFFPSSVSLPLHPNSLQPHLSSTFLFPSLSLISPGWFLLLLLILLPIYQSMTSETKKNYLPSLTQCPAQCPPFCCSLHNAMNFYWMNLSRCFSGSLAIVPLSSYPLRSLHCQIHFPTTNFYTLTHKYTSAAHCLSCSADKITHTLLPGTWP